MSVTSKRVKFILATAFTTAMVCTSAGALYVGVNTATTSLNFRDSANGDIIGSIPGGARVAVINNSSDWYKVAYGGAAGYVSKDYIVGDSDGDVSLGTGVITGDDVNIRKTPSTDGDVLLTLDTEDSVDVNGVVDGWYRIAIDETVGYIHADYISFGEEQTDTQESHSHAEESSDSADKLLSYAAQFLGTPYRYGGSTPSGFDCSGFTSYVYRNALGISIPRTSKEQSVTYTKISSISELKPGDLVFFGSGSVSHVGIYVGDGQFIHSPHTGSVVKYDTLSSGNYNKRFLWGGRVLS